jgi:hypothetical protein
MIDRRRAPRKSTAQYGEVVMANQTIQCEIVDTSATGARLVFNHARVLPWNFRLRFDVDGHEEMVQMIWRKGPVVGVSYQRPTRLKPLRDRPAATI